MFYLPPLPFDKNALEPYISAATIEYHYEKHHRGYLNKLCTAIDGSNESDKTLETLIQTTQDKKIFNLAAQVWNHSFYWQCLSPNGGGEPPEALANHLADAFGSVDKFKQSIATAANTQFGSGWAWLVLTEEKQLSVVSTSNADNPLTKQQHPLFTIDVWEHAYYLDYKSSRNQYIDIVLNKLINWHFMLQNFQATNI